MKESNVAHIVIEIDAGHVEYAATAPDAMSLLKSSVVLTQKERVDTNTGPCTLSLKFDCRGQVCVCKLTKVWSPKEASSDAHKIDLESLADY